MPPAATERNKNLSFRGRCWPEEPAFSCAFENLPFDTFRKRPLQRGFTLLELMVATAIFLVICAAMFSLLQLSQQRYSSESQLSGSFGEARLGIDQIIRDINIAGYPAPSLFSNPSSSAAYAISPFAWEPNYNSGSLSAACQVGSTCTSPGPFDLIIETNFAGPSTTPPPPAIVNWIRYLLSGTTLLRGVAPKTAGGDPLSAIPPASMTPLVENVVNNAPSLSPALAAQITAQHPTMFATGSVPLFQYSCATPSGSQPCASAAASGYNQPQNIGDIDVTLIVKTPQGDTQTQSLQIMELTGRGHQSNPAN
jgi:prepilin-type N-terminal cleavage/methylation domain-containing protein